MCDYSLELVASRPAKVGDKLVSAGFPHTPTRGFVLARFRQVNKGRSHAHNDALEFPDGKIVLLTQLCKGQHATVLQLPVNSPVTANEAQKRVSPVA